jgi:hypothetical protein
VHGHLRCAAVDPVHVMYVKPISLSKHLISS